MLLADVQPYFVLSSNCIDILWIVVISQEMNSLFKWKQKIKTYRKWRKFVSKTDIFDQE